MEMTLTSPLGLALRRDLGAHLAARAGKERFRDDVAFAEYYLDRRPNPLQSNLSRIWNTYNRSITEGSPGDGKSEWFFVKVLQLFAFNRRARFLYGTSTVDLAADLGAKLIRQFEGNQKLIADFGPFQDTKGPWTPNKFRLLGADPLEKSPSFFGVGVGKPIEGFRGTHGGIDDVSTMLEMFSPATRLHNHVWMDGTFMERLESGAPVWGVGSPWDLDDTNAHIAKRPDFHYDAFPTIVDEEKHLNLCPDRFNWEDIENKRKANPSMFALRNMLNRRAFSGSKLKPSDLRYCLLSEVNPGWMKITGWDFNFSESQRAHRTTGVTIAADDNRTNFYILDIYAEHLSEGHDRAIVDQWLKWHPHKVPVESDLAQRMIIPLVRTHNFPIPIVSAPTKGIPKPIRLMRWEPFLTQHRVFVVEGCPHVDLLIDEMTRFVGQDETPTKSFDVLDGGEKAMSGFAGGGRSASMIL